MSRICFLGIVDVATLNGTLVTKGRGARIVALHKNGNQKDWQDCDQAVARIATEDDETKAFVELRGNRNRELSTQLVVNGNSIVFPITTPNPGLFRAFDSENAAKRWIKSKTQ